ncbi:MAG: TonB-dependent receptor, partial [Acidobacteria bacterium]|nr:TonB-dependent receptor [Acidobacteriota bacterium]
CNSGQFANQGGFALNINPAGASLGIQNATTCNTPQRRNSPVKQFSDTVTYVRGQHNFNFGGNVSQINAWLVSAPGGAVPTIEFVQDINDPVNAAFQPANLPGSPSATIAAQAENLFRVLTGRITSISGTAALNEAGDAYTFNQNFVERYRQRELGFFGQDSWRIRPNLTLNLGLRWDIQYAPISQNKSLTQNTFQGLFGRSGNDLQSTLFHPGATGGTPTQFTPLPAGQHLYATDLSNFLPSVGFAWQPDFKNGFLHWLQGNSGQTVIRGGWSMATLRDGLNLTSSIVGANFGGTVDAARISTRNFAPGTAFLRSIGSLAPPTFPTAPAFPLQPEGIGTTGAGPNASANAFSPNLKTPYVISFTGGIQRELTKNMVMEVRYVGNRGHQLFRQLNLNELNTVENGLYREFLSAMNNLAANRAAGAGNTFAFTGRPGTVPLPITLAFFQSIPVNDPRNQTAASYTSSFFTNGTFLTTLSPVAPNALTFAGLLNNPANGLIQRAITGGLPANFIVLNPQVRGGTFLVNNDGKTWYDGLTIEVRRRMSHGLLLQANYTFSKSQTNFYASSSIAFSQPRTLRNTWLDKTWSPFDIRQALKLNWIYEMPFGRGKMFFGDAHGLLNGLLGDWSFHGTSRIQSGSPILLGNVQLVNMTVKDLQKAIEIRKLPNRQIVWLADDIALNTFRAFNFNSVGFTQGAPTGRFIAPANFNGCVQAFAGQCGFANLALHGPRFVRIDMSAVKKFRFTEKSNLEFRVEALNVINNVNFKLGDYATDAASVGQTVGGQIAVPTFSSSLFGQLNGNGNAYRDTSTTNDPGGRILQLVFRFNF